MGLFLCKWLCSLPTWRTVASCSSSSSSPFLPRAVPMTSRLRVLLDGPPVCLADPRSFWSPSHHSPNFSLELGGGVAQRMPAQQSTDGARAALGERSGLHVWEVHWDPAERGSHAVVGVATENWTLQTLGYSVLLGSDTESWGWELGSNQLWHSDVPQGLYPHNRKEAECEHTPLVVPGTILMVLDADEGTLSFVVDGCFLGVAVRNLPRGALLFPAVSSVWGGSRISLRYLNGAPREPPLLLSLCQLTVRQALGKDRVTCVDQLPLPSALRQLF